MAQFIEKPDALAPLARRVFHHHEQPDTTPLPLLLIGTPFDVNVWQALLRIPMGCAVTYTAIAEHLGLPVTAARAVGTAGGRNPISFVVPCHRAMRGDGNLAGYYWGLTRKRAMLAWETGRTTRDHAPTGLDQKNA
jgi:AraC family transcriptional regulator of adaptative response/methylated-DNA-[protein]-cysteine methyltransferase